MRMVRVVSRVGTAAILVVSGVYLVLYLYRWEWNRALIAGVFFLAAEIAVVGIMLADRLSDQARPVPGGAERATGAAGSAPRFPWLEPDRLSVFVPVLIGAGALVSIGAYLIERVARATAPAGPSPVLARLAAGADDPPAAARRPRPLALIGLGAAAVVLAVGLQVLADLAQARNDPPRAGWQTEIELEISQKRATASTLRQAERLVLLCVPEGYDATLGPPAGDAITLTVTPAPGRTDHRKLIGCLSDARLDRVLVDLGDVTSTPVG